VKIRRADLSSLRDSAAIDEFVMAHDDAQLFHRPQWSRAVEAGCGATSHYLVAEDGSGITGLLPLSEIRSPLFGNSLVSVGFAVRGGIVAANRESAEALGEAGWKMAESCGVPGLELRGGYFPEGPWTFSNDVYANFAADLSAGGDEAILLSIKKRQRAEVRRALTYDLDYREGVTDADLDVHFAIYGASVRNLGSPVFPRKLFRAMAAEFGQDAMILNVFKDGSPLSSVFSFQFKAGMYPYWGGGTQDSRDWRANEAAYYDLMCRAARRGCTRIDFGRSKFGTGPFAFKKNWGLEPEPLTYAVRTANGLPPREINPMNPKYRIQVAAWKKLPLPIANRLGPLIARGLG
jgi:FemAB-related protein (PEP-CTERM system-associated)